MKMKILYFDNEVFFDNNSINAIEIENKSLFYKFITDINNLIVDGSSSNIFFFDNDMNEISYKNIKEVSNYISFDFNSKKLINEINKYVSNCILEQDKINIVKEYNKFLNIFRKYLKEVELPILIEDFDNFDNMLKSVNMCLRLNDSLLENLFLMIELEKELKTNKIIVFINLKQYISKDELIELYKYSIYNEVNILLVDSQPYGTTISYEKKLIVDDNLDEFVL